MAVRICPECQGKVALSRSDCPHCGHKFNIDTKICPECEAEVPSSVNECPECGHIFNNAAPVMAAAMQQPKADEPIKEEKRANGIVCPQCGSGDTTKIDEYTYKCNMCSTIISLPRPDTNITNINSFVGSVDDIPVYQVKQTMTEREFVRKAVMNLAYDSDVSPDFLEGYHANESQVTMAYITYAEMPYSCDVSYSCRIGTDHSYEDRDGHSHTETIWTPFSGVDNEGGIAFVCTYGDETDIQFETPIYSKSGNDEIIPFAEHDNFPLKKRVDRSVQEEKKSDLIYSLALRCRMNLPRGQIDGWKYSGRVSFEKIDTFYYVPSYNLTAESNGHKITFAAPATKDGYIYKSFAEGKDVAKSGTKTKPNDYSAKAEFKAMQPLYGVSLAATIIGFILMGLSPVLALMFMNAYMLIAMPFGLATGITGAVIRKKTVSAVYNNQLCSYKNAKAEACAKCLYENNLDPMSEAEKSSIDASSMHKIPLKEDSKKTACLVLLILTIAVFLVFLIICIAALMKR